MKKLLAIAVLLLTVLLCSPAWATLTRASAAATVCTTTSTTCTKVQTINTGDMVVVLMSAAANAITISSVSDTVNSLVHVASSNVTDGSNSEDVFWLNSAASNSGHTTLTVTVNAAPNAAWSFHVLRYTTTGSTPVIDTGAVATATKSATSNWVGPTISPTGGNDVILQASFNPLVNFTAVAAPYTAALGTSSHFMTAENINTTASTSATFTNGSSSGVMSSVGFTDLINSGRHKKVIWY